jgi:TetR/AcrR family transcriptional regulator, regulator of cefoperazone and chloramphenicol sensitivity
MAEPVKRRRPYSSERRRESALQTRKRILDAAAARFVEHGFAGTTIAAVAADASTAAETVYATFGSKVALLEAVLRAAARGEEDSEILEQEGPARVAAADTQREQLALFADDITRRLARTGPLLGVVAAAAASEPALAELARRIHEARLANLRIVPGLLERNGPLRLEAEEASETIWALASPELYLLLTEQRGWSRTRYAEWLAASLAALLLVSQSVPPSHDPS